MKKAVVFCSVICLFLLAGSLKASAQYSECYASSQYYGNCSVSSGSTSVTPNSAGGWVMYAPTGHLSYSMYVYSYSTGNNQAVIWGDGPNVNLWSPGTDSGSMSVSSTQAVYVDVEVWAQDGAAGITVNTW